MLVDSGRLFWAHHLHGEHVPHSHQNCLRPRSPARLYGHPGSGRSQHGRVAEPGGRLEGELVDKALKTQT